MVCANPGAIRYRSGKFRQHLAIPMNASRVRYASVLLIVRRVEIAASALCYLDDRMVILLRDLGNQVVDSTRPYL